MTVKPKRTFNWFLENGMIYLFLVYLIFFYSFIGFYPYGYSLNRTVGWFYNLTGLRFFFPILLVIYLLGFFIIALLKLKTSKQISLLFLVTLIFGILMNELGFPEIEVFLYFVSMVMFVILFFKSFITRIFKLK